MMLRMTPHVPALPPTSILPPSPLVVGQALTGAFAIMRRRLGLFVALAFVPGLIAIAIVLGLVVVGAAALWGAFAGATTGARTCNVGGAIALVVALALVAIVVVAAIQIKANGMIVLLAHETALGRRPDYQALNQGTRGIVGRTVALILVAALAVIVVGGVLMGIMVAAFMPLAVQGDSTALPRNFGALIGLYFLVMAALLVAELYFGTRWLYLNQGLAVEGRGGFAALGSSWRLTRGNFWRTLGWDLLAGVMIFAVTMVFELVGNGLLTPVMNSITKGNSPLAGVGGALLLLYGLFLAVLQGLVVPFQLAYTTVMYIDQRRRNDLAAGGAPLAGQPQQYPTQQYPTQQYPAQQYPAQPGYGTPTPGAFGAPAQPGSPTSGWTPPGQPGGYPPPTQPGATAYDPWQRPAQPPTDGVQHP